MACQDRLVEHFRCRTVRLGFVRGHRTIFVGILSTIFPWRRRQVSAGVLISVGVTLITHTFLC